MKAQLSTPAMRKTLSLFAELISRQLASEVVLGRTRDALDDAIETSMLREQFIAVLSHDVRTPLSTILNGIDVLGQVVDPSALQLLETMRRSGKRISSLIEDVADFARGRMGGGIAVDMRRERNFEDSLRQVVEELRHVYPGRTIDAEIPSGIDITCDGHRIAQLLSNLLKNAIVHGSPSEPVLLRVISTPDVFQMAVTNFGPQIPPEIQAQLFKPFWQGSNCGSKKGLGLGLYIASEIARSHGGRLEVASSAGQTTFTYQVRCQRPAGKNDYA